MDLQACVKLREDAARCRRLVNCVTDKRTIDSLEQSAREFDAEADRIEAEDVRK
jgi:Flp pilus assembly CpaE family ATPase